METSTGIYQHTGGSTAGTGFMGGRWLTPMVTFEIIILFEGIA
jgi:hypothetical protein